MDLKSWGKLLVEIERERRELYRISKHEPENIQKLIQASQRLDKLIMEYQKVKTPCYCQQ